MPEKPDYGKNDEGKTIVGFASTETGSRFPILEGEDKKEALARHLHAIETKKFVKRFGLSKTPFKIREEVVYDDFKKIGIVTGFVGDSINILGKDGKRLSKSKDFVFKKTELINGVHWDALDLKDRLAILKTSHVSDRYLNSSWYFIPYQARNAMIKAMGPAGYEGGGLNTTTTGVFNPVHQDKTVSERIEEEEKKPNKNPTIADEKHEEKPKEESKKPEQKMGY